MTDFPHDPRGYSINRDGDDRSMRVLPLKARLTRLLGQQQQRKIEADSAGESGPPKWKQPADARAVRGIPAIGALGGAIAGTTPECAVDLSPTSPARREPSRPEKADPLRLRRRRS